MRISGEIYSSLWKVKRSAVSGDGGGGMEEQGACLGCVASGGPSLRKVASGVNSDPSRGRKSNPGRGDSMTWGPDVAKRNELGCKGPLFHRFKAGRRSGESRGLTSPGRNVAHSCPASARPQHCWGWMTVTGVDFYPRRVALFVCLFVFFSSSHFRAAIGVKPHLLPEVVIKSSQSHFLFWEDVQSIGFPPPPRRSGTARLSVASGRRRRGRGERVTSFDINSSVMGMNRKNHQAALGSSTVVGHNGFPRGAASDAEPRLMRQPPRLRLSSPVPQSR